MTDKELIGVWTTMVLGPLPWEKEIRIFACFESCGITAMGGEFIRDIEPGEIVVINEEGVNA